MAIHHHHSGLSPDQSKRTSIDHSEPVEQTITPQRLAERNFDATRESTATAPLPLALCWAIWVSASALLWMVILEVLGLAF